MTITEFKKRLFPCVYKTRDGKLVEINELAFKGVFLDMPDRQYVWDEKMNFFIPTSFYMKDYKNVDLVELVKSPIMEKQKII